MLLRISFDIKYWLRPDREEKEILSEDTSMVRRIGGGIPTSTRELIFCWLSEVRKIDTHNFPMIVTPNFAVRSCRDMIERLKKFVREERAPRALLRTHHRPHVSQA